MPCARFVGERRAFVLLSPIILPLAAVRYLLLMRRVKRQAKQQSCFGCNTPLAQAKFHTFRFFRDVRQDGPTEAFFNRYPVCTCNSCGTPYEYGFSMDLRYVLRPYGPIY